MTLRDRLAAHRKRQGWRGCVSYPVTIQREAREHIRALRRRGVSWYRIGQELGISLQTAQVWARKRMPRPRTRWAWLRAQTTLTVRDVGDIVDVSKQSVSAYETGKRNPSPVIRERLERLYQHKGVL